MPRCRVQQQHSPQIVPYSLQIYEIDKFSVSVSSMCSRREGSYSNQAHASFN